MIGTTIGNYRIVEKLGAGGMGEVYRAIDTVLEREVALKSLHPFLTQDPGRLERFRSEAITLARLNHPNIAILHNFFQHGDVHYMVMEYVEGENFESLIRRFGRVPLRRTLEMFTEALKGFEHAHAKQVIHRDIKPANLMLNSEGVVKITDFGIARVVGGERLTQTGKLIGTLEYMSPEQVRGQEQDARSDIYSLGILLYEMVSGEVPFRSESDFEIMRSHLEAAPRSLRDLTADVPAEIEAIINKALAKDPAQRYANVREFRQALEPILASLPASAPEIVPQLRATREAVVADFSAVPGVPTAGVPTADVAAAAPTPPATREGRASGSAAGVLPVWLKPRVAMAVAAGLLLVVMMSAAAMMKFRSALSSTNTAGVALQGTATDGDESSTPGAASKISVKESLPDDVPPLVPIVEEEPQPRITPLPKVVKPTPKPAPKPAVKPAPKPVAKTAVKRASSNTKRSPRVRRTPRRVVEPRRKRVVKKRSTPVKRRRPRSSGGGGGEAALRAAIKNN